MGQVAGGRSGHTFEVSTRIRIDVSIRISTIRIVLELARNFGSEQEFFAI